MQAWQQETSSEELSRLNPKVWGPYIPKILGGLVGLVYSPLTLPFIYAGHDTYVIHETNAKLWHSWVPNKSEDSSINYIAAPLVVSGNTLGRFLWLIAKFPVNFVYSFYRGTIDGYQGGFLQSLINPSRSFNRYDTKGHLASLFNQKDATGHSIRCYQFRSQHLLSLAIFLTFFISIIVATALFFLPTLVPVAFTPVAILAKTTGIKLATLLGINATGYAIPLINFATTLILTFPAIMALESAIFALIYLGKGAGEFFKGIINPKSQSYDGYRITFALKKIISLLDKCVAIVVGMPLYILYKPCFQLLDSLRLILKTNKAIWKDGKKNAETHSTGKGRERIGNSFSYEYFYKAGVSIVLLCNTIGRLILLPFQIASSLLYAPFQCVRHATKYGISHVLSYPYRYANSYRNKLLVKGKGNREYTGRKEDYNKVHVAKAENVYYFKKKHIALLAALSGLAFVLLASFIPPLGYLSISLTVKALTPLGLFEASAAGMTVLIVNFITGAAAITAIAVGLWATSWLLAKTSAALQSMKQLLTRSKHFHNLSHSSVSAGDALRVMTRENLAVKTLNSVIDGKKSNSATDEENKEIEKINHSWAFNFKQLLDPAGIRFKPGILQQPRPVYHAKERKFSRHAVYKRVNPKTNETETRIMPGERGRAKWGDWFISNITLGFKRLYTKKTGVSLAPKDGTMAFFTRGDDDPIGLGFNITMLDIKDEKYVFEYDGDTNAKWWWHFRYVAYSKDPNLSYIIKKCITIQELKNINRALRRRGEVPRYNEILACLTAEALVAVVVSKDILSFRINSIFRKMIIKHKLGIDLPILMMGMLFNGNSTITTREYTVEEQIFDLFDLSTNSTYETESIFDAVAKQYNEKHKAKSPDSKKDFVKTLVNTHPVNWATLFNDRQVSSVKEKNFKQFINDATGIDLDKKVDYKPMGTHLSTCVT